MVVEFRNVRENFLIAVAFQIERKVRSGNGDEIEKGEFREEKIIGICDWGTAPSPIGQGACPRRKRKTCPYGSRMSSAINFSFHERRSIPKSGVLDCGNV
jgi:hypothetical protein